MSATVTEAATTVAAVCGAVVAVGAAAAAVVRMGRWAYAQQNRRHRLDEIVALAPKLEKVVHELLPNSGHSLHDRVTHLTTEAFPELSERVVNIEGYVDELKQREQRRGPTSYREANSTREP